MVADRGTRRVVREQGSPYGPADRVFPPSAAGPSLYRDLPGRPHRSPHRELTRSTEVQTMFKRLAAATFAAAALLAATVGTSLAAGPQVSTWSNDVDVPYVDCGD